MALFQSDDPIASHDSVRESCAKTLASEAHRPEVMNAYLRRSHGQLELSSSQQVVKALAPFIPEPRVVAALVYQLRNNQWDNVQRHAIEALRSVAHLPEVAEALQHFAQHAAEPEIRWSAFRALAGSLTDDQIYQFNLFNVHQEDPSARARRDLASIPERLITALYSKKKDRKHLTESRRNGVYAALRGYLRHSVVRAGTLREINRRIGRTVNDGETAELIHRMFQNLVFTEERSIIDPQEVAELLTFKGHLKKNSPLQLSASEMALHLLGNNLSRISPRQAEALLNAARPAMDRHRQLREHAVSGHPFRNDFIPTPTDDEFLRRCDRAMERMRPMQGVTLEALDNESHAQRRLIENLDNFCRLPSELREHFKSAAEAAFSHAFAVRDPSDEFMRDFRDLVLRIEASADPSPSTASRITQGTVATSTPAPETVVNSNLASQEVLPIHQRISRFLKRLVGRDPQAKKIAPVPIRLMEPLTREQGATALEILQQNEPAIEALLMRHELNLRSRTAHQNPITQSNGAGVRVAENNPDAPATSEVIAYDELSEETRPALRTATQSHCIGESLNRSVNR